MCLFLFRDVWLDDVQQTGVKPQQSRGSMLRNCRLPTTALLIDGVAVNPAESVRALGIYIEYDMVMTMHEKRTVSQCFAVL